MVVDLSEDVPDQGPREDADAGDVIALGDDTGDTPPVNRDDASRENNTSKDNREQNTTANPPRATTTPQPAPPPQQPPQEQGQPESEQAILERMVEQEEAKEKQGQKGKGLAQQKPNKPKNSTTTEMGNQKQKPAQGAATGGESSK